MVEATGEVTSTEQKRRRRTAKNFPLSPFHDVLVLAQTIHEHGLDGQLRRITVFDRLGRSPDSSTSRQLVTDSGRYGLTSGSYQAEYLKLTEEGAKVVNPEMTPLERRRTEFELAVAHVQPFTLLYERLKGKRIPASDVMHDELTSIPQQDRALCARVFMENARHLGLVQELAGAERIISIEQALEGLPDKPPQLPPNQESKHEEVEKPLPRTPKEPVVHIDVNIHIDAGASPDQIDAVFASMARHLYRRES